MAQKNEVIKLRIRHMPEEFPDLSYLTHHLAGPEYEVQDNERLEAYNNGQWAMIGIRAEAEVKIYSGKSYIITTISSAGLWGIESDSNEEYIHEVEQEELEQLHKQLKDLNIKVIAKDVNEIEVIKGEV